MLVADVTVPPLPRAWPRTWPEVQVALRRLIGWDAPASERVGLTSTRTVDLPLPVANRDGASAASASESGRARVALRRGGPGSGLALPCLAWPDPASGPGPGPGPAIWQMPRLPVARSGRAASAGALTGDRSHGGRRDSMALATQWHRPWSRTRGGPIWGVWAAWLLLVARSVSLALSGKRGRLVLSASQ